MPNTYLVYLAVFQILDNNKMGVAAKKRRTKTPVFLACEGKSEKSYGRWLGRLAHKHKIPVAIKAIDLKGGGPLELVECAIEKLAQLERTGGRFRHRAILLDKDLFKNTQRDKKAIRAAGLKNFSLIWQEPIHEVFLLRHFLGNEKKISADKAEAIKLLNVDVWRGYKPGLETINYESKLTLDNLLIARGNEPDFNNFLDRIGWQ